MFIPGLSAENRLVLRSSVDHGTSYSGEQLAMVTGVRNFGSGNTYDFGARFVVPVGGRTPSR